MMISGTEYYLRLRRMTQEQLASQAGISKGFLAKILQCTDYSNIRISGLVRISDALGVPVDDLLEMKDEGELDGGHYLPPSRSDNPHNSVAVYRLAKGITYETLGVRLGGLTRQGAQKICKYDHPSAKHISRLASYEHMSPEAFRSLYSSPEEGGMSA